MKGKKTARPEWMPTSSLTKTHNLEKQTMTDYPNKYHDDGTITYWSVHQQQWIRHAGEIPDQELAAMTEQERMQVASFLSIPGGSEFSMNPDTGSVDTLENWQADQASAGWPLDDLKKLVPVRWAGSEWVEE